MTGKIGLSQTEFCTRQVRGLQIVQTFSYEVKPKLKNSWCQMNTHILNICIIPKNSACLQYVLNGMSENWS